MAANARDATGGDAIYARYSSELQNPRSIEDQVTDLREAVARSGGLAEAAAVFSDAETSGAVWERPGLQELLRAVESGRVRRIFVEDGSRLARDIGDADRFRKILQHHGVTLVSGDGAGLDGSTGAALTYSVKAVLSEQYLQELGKKTFRGQKGNAREGKATGGKTYGYRTAAEAKIETVPERAEVVRRIFALYAQGYGYARIAAVLNADGIEPPRGSNRRAGPGWIASCIREMLRNPKYIGQWSFGVWEWRKHPTTRKRQPRKRDEGSILRTELPELAIVDRATWDSVQARLNEHAADYQRTSGQRQGHHRKTDHLLSGLLRCGCCGALMQLSGGSSDRYYRCSANKKRGTCENRLTVRESIAKAKLLQAISAALWNPAALERIRGQVAERLGALSRELNRELKDRRARLTRHEERIRSTITMQLDGDRSPYLADMRRDFEAQATTERAAIAELELRSEAPIFLPTQSGIEDRVLTLETMREAEGAAVEPAREQLRRLLKGGVIACTPEPFGDGQAYVARAELLPLEIMMAERTPPGSEAGLCPRVVARARNDAWTHGVRVPLEVRLAA